MLRQPVGAPAGAQAAGNAPSGVKAAYPTIKSETEYAKRRAFDGQQVRAGAGLSCKRRLPPPCRRRRLPPPLRNPCFRTSFCLAGEAEQKGSQGRRERAGSHRGASGGDAGAADDAGCAGRCGGSCGGPALRVRHMAALLPASASPARDPSFKFQSHSLVNGIPASPCSPTDFSGLFPKTGAAPLRRDQRGAAPAQHQQQQQQPGVKGGPARTFEHLPSQRQSRQVLGELLPGSSYQLPPALQQAGDATNVTSAAPASAGGDRQLPPSESGGRGGGPERL